MCNRMMKSELSASDRETVEEIERAYGVEVLEVAPTQEVKIRGLLGSESVGPRPTLINGQAVKRVDWPEVVRINVGGGGCTATLVGPNCAITAAHCGADGASGSAELYDGSKVLFTVFRMPQYQDANAQYDLSVLKISRPVFPVTQFARFGFDHSFSNGQEVFIAGYGCTRPGGGGGNDGVLRTGPSRVVGSTGTDVITEWREKPGAALCFGDSGGPMFSNPATAGNRVLVAVNSKGNIRDTNYNMKLNLPQVRDFVTAVAAGESLKIKGLNFDDQKPPSPPPPAPDFESAIVATVRTFGYTVTKVG